MAQPPIPSDALRLSRQAAARLREWKASISAHHLMQVAPNSDDDDEGCDEQLRSPPYRLPTPSLEACESETCADAQRDDVSDCAATARTGDLTFVGRGGPRRDKTTMDGIAHDDQGYEPHTLALRDYLDGCHAKDVDSGYDPVLGYGDEASRPPDYNNPEDDVAYPEGVIFEDDPDYDDGGHGSYDDGHYDDDGYDDGDRYGGDGREDDFYDAYHDGG